MYRVSVILGAIVILAAALFWGAMEHKGRVLVSQDRDHWKAVSQGQARSIKQAAAANHKLREEKKALIDASNSKRKALSAATAASAADWAKQEIPESVRKALE